MGTMVYVEWIDDEGGDAIDVNTYCEAHAPDLGNAWPCWSAEAYCYVCGLHLLGMGTVKQAERDRWKR